MGCAGDPAAGVRAAAEAAGELGEPAEEQELLDPAAAPGYQRRHSKGRPCTWTWGVQPLVLAVVQSLGHVQLFVTPWTAARQASFTISQSLLKLISIESVMPSTCLVLCYPLVLRLLVTGGLGQSVRLEEPEVALCLSIWEAFHVQFTCSGHGKCQTSDWKTLLSPKLAIRQMVFFFFLLPIIPKSVFFCINLSAAILIGNKIKYH